MTLKVGWHFLEDSYYGPALPSAVFLNPSEWGESRGHVVGMRSGLRLCRPYWKGRPPAGEIAAKALHWAGHGCKVVVGNEPNHPIEQFNGTPADYRALFEDVRGLAPGTQLYWAGPSPGFPDWREWLRGAEVADGIALHAYGTFQQMREIADWTLANVPRVPIWVAECNFGAGQQVDRDVWARDQFRPFLDWCAAQPRVEAVSYFAYRWPTPDSALITPVDGAGTGIEDVLRTWQAPLEPGDSVKIIDMGSTHSSSREGHRVKRIIAHSTVSPAGGTLEDTARYLVRNERRVSIHELVGPNTVYRMVPDSLAAHHAWSETVNIPGVPRDYANLETWGIEGYQVAGQPTAPDVVALMVERVAAACQRQGLTASDVFSHGEVDPSRRSDPVGVDMNQFRARVAALLVPPVPVPVPVPAPSPWVVGSGVLKRMAELSDAPRSHEMYNEHGSETIGARYVYKWIKDTGEVVALARVS